MHVKFSFCSRIKTYLLLTLRLHVRLRLLLPVPLLLVAGHNNLPALLLAATKEKRSEIRMCMKFFHFVCGCKLTSVAIKLNNQPSSCRRRPLPNCSRRDCRRNPGTGRQDGAGETSEGADTAADRSYRDDAEKLVCGTLEWVRTNLKIGRRYGTPRGYSYAVTSRHLRVPL